MNTKVEYDRLLTFQLENQSAYLEWVRTSILLFGFGVTILTFTEGKFWTVSLIFLFSLLFLIEGYISYQDYSKAIIDNSIIPRSFITINFWLVIILYIGIMFIVYKDRKELHPIYV